MRMGVALAGVSALVVSTYLVVVLVSPRPLSSQPSQQPAAADDDTPPVVARSGPQPKAVIDQTDFDFGRMEVGEERRHEFTIRNEGRAPLVVKKGTTTCQCTVSDVDTGELAVGATAKITLKWKPTGPAEQFGKGATILTNDPDNQVIHLKILGMVVKRLVTVPGKDWEAPAIAVGEPTVFTGLVISPVVDRFQVVGLSCQSPFVTAECLPIEPEQLKSRDGLSGYQIQISISPEIPIGAFSVPLTIKTDLPGRAADGSLGDAMQVEVTISGHRRGPLRVIGREWDEDRMAIALGSFDATEGRKLTLLVFVRGAPAEGLKLTEPAQCNPEALQVKLAPDERATGKQSRYLLTLEYPAGSPRVTYLKDHPATVHLHTNHPAANQVDLQVFFSAN
jgi:hypothetical protein